MYSSHNVSDLKNVSASAFRSLKEINVIPRMYLYTYNWNEWVNLTGCIQVTTHSTSNASGLFLVNHTTQCKRRKMAARFPVNKCNK